MAILEVNNIVKAFGQHVVLNGIDFSLEQGEVLAIIGSSGSGKTTLLRCLNFLETPDTGTIRVWEETLFDAADKRKLSFAERRERQLKFGLVFQSFNLFPQYTVKRNLTIAAELRAKSEFRRQKTELQERKERMEAIAAKADELLATVGLSDRADYFPSQLSGGQQQRVAIARALMLSPEILCFDEPTSALDPELTGEVLKAIRALKNSERTMIIVTHEMEFARNVADHVIFMADGVIEEEGTAEDVFEHPQSEKTKLFLSHSKEK